MNFISQYSIQLINTGILFLIIVVLRTIIIRLIRRYAKLSEVLDSRANLIIKYVSILFMILAVSGIIIIWGVKTDNIITVLSGVITVIGVAFFAQWSILSNITSGIILLFSFPFKIGDYIRLHDKDFPIEAEIIDIRGFYTLLRTIDGEMMSYPNNILLQKGISIIDKLSPIPSEYTD